MSCLSAHPVTRCRRGAGRASTASVKLAADILQGSDLGRAYHPLRTYRADRDYYDYRKHPTRKCSAKGMYTVDLPPRMRTTLGHKDRDKVLVLRSYAELVAWRLARRTGW